MMESHGGNIYRAARELEVPEQKILDFSASINPLGVPQSVAAAIRKHIRYLYHYPDPDAGQLAARIGKKYGINHESIICGNGSTELIHLVARALKSAHAVIPAPTFCEYERAVKLQYREKKITIRHPLLDGSNSFDINPDHFINAMEGCTLAFLCNPNNPTGRLIERKTILGIADAARALQCHLVVDEAFIDFVPGQSIIKEVETNPYLIVLRSMTKFYALSGLRLGFGVFPLSLVETVKRHKEPWTVSTLAQRAGIAALDDAAYKKETLKVIREEKKFIERELKRLQITYIPSAANYYLLRIEHASTIVRLLRQRGILVRDCSNFVGIAGSYIRIAVRSHKENRRLLKELARVCRASS
ncbi:MAG: threonine-phosphate decarboxylase CobD [Nitrospirota bacterium]